MGRAHVFAQAAAALGDTRWLDEARRVGDAVLHRALHTGSFQLGWGDSMTIGLFTGITGIAYELLRLAHPGTLPSVLSWR
jgi:lantibiotic modifying enzyme